MRRYPFAFLFLFLFLTLPVLLLAVPAASAAAAPGAQVLTAPEKKAGPAAQAQGGPEQAVNLRQAVRAALRDNPEIKARHWALRASEEAVGVQRGYFYPSLSFESRYLRTDNPTYAFMAKLDQQRFSASDFAIDKLNSPASVNDFQNSFKLDQVIYSRRLIEALKMSREDRAAKGLDFDRLRQKVTMETVRAYLGVITARNFLGAAKKAVEDTAEHERLAKLRFGSGLGLYSDVLRADAALKEAQSGEARAQSAYEVAKRALGLVMGRAESVDALGTGYKVELDPVGTYYASAEERPDIKAIEARYKNAKNAVALATSGYYPEIGARGQYQWNDHRSPIDGEGSSYQVAAFLRWSIFDGTRREHEVSQAKSRVHEAREGLDGAKKEALFKVFAAYQDVQEAQKSLDYARAELASAREGRRLVELRYKNSLSPIIDLLDSQTMVDSARTRSIEAQNNLLEKYFNLGFESGRISEFIEKISQYSE
ncbi:MAG: TolC family protein [Nitrospiraceae bacterium]|nr:TolC family protein [Nitrospiraceae bacterium]